MRDLYPELSAPPSNPPLQVLPSQCVQHHGASETVPVSTDNRWLAWFFQLLSPTFLCVLLWNSIETIKFSAKTFGLILFETVLGQCGRFWRSWCSRKRGARRADADTIPTLAGCKELGCCGVLLMLIFFMLGSSLTLQELKRSDALRYQENQQVIFRLFSFGILLIISIGPIYSMGMSSKSGKASVENCSLSATPTAYNSILHFLQDLRGSSSAVGLART